MKRLFPAVLLAAMIHGALLAANIPWTAPRLLSPKSREVTISLVHVAKPSPKPTIKPAAARRQSVQRPQPRLMPKAKPQPSIKRTQPTPQPITKPKPARKNIQTAVIEDQQTAPEDLQPIEEWDGDLAPPPQSEETGAVVQVSVPLYDLNPSPNYPRVAQRRRYQGTVLLDVLVDTAGNATQVKLAQSSGYNLLDHSAMADVQKWRFKPARKGMQPIEMWVQVPVRFQLTGN